MDINKILSPADQTRLLNKMEIEYTASDNYTREWKSDVQNVRQDYLVPKAGQDKVKIKRVLNLMKMKRSIFKTDDEQVKAVSMNGKLGDDVASNFNKIAKANYKSMDLRLKKGKAQDDDTLFGIGTLAVDGWNNFTQEPIVSYIDSRLTFPDPSNSEGNYMRFFGTLLQKTIYELEGDEAYDFKRVQEVRMERNTEIEQIQRDNGNYEGDVGDDLVSIYNHITIFKPSDEEEYFKCLTTWNASRTKLLRFIKMQPLSDDEKADPSKITLGVTLYRGIPIPGQYQGASAIDEVGPYQDLETLITNLQVEQALRNVVGGKTIIDNELGIDENDYATLEPGQVIIANRQVGSQTTVSNGVYKESPEPASQVVENTLSRLSMLGQEATLQNSLAQGQSLSGTQTKAEVQTIQQNSNQILSGIASEYIEAGINLWTDIFKSYMRNMSSQRVKKIALLTDDGQADSYGFKKKEFIGDGSMFITITSKAQEEIRDKQDYAIMLSLDASISQMFQIGSPELAIWKRKLLNKSGIRGLKGEDIQHYTQEERKAYSQLKLLNQDIELKSKPKPGENHNIFIQIFKNGIPTPARDKAIAIREEILEKTPKPTPVQEEQVKGGGGGIGASMIASDHSQGTPASLGDIKA